MLQKFLPAARHLTVLDQGGKEIGLLLRQVESFPEYRLKMLQLWRCSVPKEVMEPLVLYFSSLTLLDLSESYLPKEGFDILGRALQGNSRLKKLRDRKEIMGVDRSHPRVF